VEICVEAELDEQWSFVGSKKNQMWLWYALSKKTKIVLAFIFGKRTDDSFQQLLKLLKSIHIDNYYTDDWSSYQKYLDASKHFIGKRDTQNIERKNLDLRTRIKRLCRKTICFSKSEEMHQKVIGNFINKNLF
jgi:insertion element IS1 protein InsB